MDLVFLEKWIFQILLVSFSVTENTMRGNTVIVFDLEYHSATLIQTSFDCNDELNEQVPYSPA